MNRVFGLLPLIDSSKHGEATLYNQLTGESITLQPAPVSKSYYDFFFEDDITGIKNRPNHMKSAHDAVKSSLDRYNRLPDEYLDARSRTERDRLRNKFAQSEQKHADHTEQYEAQKAANDEVLQLVRQKVSRTTEWVDELLDVKEGCIEAGLEDEIPPTIQRLFPTEEVDYLADNEVVRFLVVPLPITEDGTLDVDPQFTPFLLLDTDETFPLVNSAGTSEDLTEYHTIKKLCQQNSIPVPDQVEEKLSNEFKVNSVQLETLMEGKKLYSVDLSDWSEPIQLEISW